MSYGPINTESPYIPTSLKLNDKEEVLIPQLERMYTSIAPRLNEREISLYYLSELTTGQKWLTSSNLQVPKTTFRKVFEFGAIAPGATLNIPHGINTITLITKWNGGFVTAARKRPLPFVSATAVTDQVQVDEDGGTNIVIVNGATAPAIISGVVIIEYLKN